MINFFVLNYFFVSVFMFFVLFEALLYSKMDLFLFFSLRNRIISFRDLLCYLIKLIFRIGAVHKVGMSRYF